MPLIFFLYCNIKYNSIMEDSNNPVVKTTEANLREAKQAIESIEAQLLEVKACIRSVEAVQSPTYTTEQLRALARKFFVMGAEAQRDNISYNSINPSVEMSGEDGEGFSWSFRGEVEIDSYDFQYADPITFEECIITDEEIDEVINDSPRGDNSQAQ